MTRDNFLSLTPSWQAWLLENIARGCAPNDIARSMTTGGGFPLQQCHRAIEEAAQTKLFPDPMPLPDINTARNVIHAPGADVEVLLTVQNPRIVLLGNVLSDAECEELVALGQDHFAKSAVVGQNGDSVLHPDRTSKGAFLHDCKAPLIAALNKRLAYLSNWPVENGEAVQLLRYDQHNEYKAHFDWFDSSTPGGKIQLQRGGQRVGTFVLYLSDVESGGGTKFPKIGLEILPKKGSAVFFQNTDELITPDRNSLHAGSPVITGVKYVANKWLRVGKFT
jgi:prolyl 4-hydroxylase